ncbi:MAG: hypothetical protein J6Y58_00420 [Clostridiales bacterium]|nr:hypothetical protein [Clostridiales bacterium]
MKKIILYALLLSMLFTMIGCSKGVTYEQASDKMILAAEEALGVEELSAKEKKKLVNGSNDFASTFYSVRLNSKDIQKRNEDYAEDFFDIDYDDFLNETCVYIYVSKADMNAHIYELVDGKTAQALFENMTEELTRHSIIDKQNEVVTVSDSSDYTHVSYYLLRNNMVTTVSFSGFYGDMDDYYEFMRLSGLRDLQDLVEDYRENKGKNHSKADEENSEIMSRAEQRIIDAAEKCCGAEEMTSKEKKYFINGHLISGVDLKEGKYVFLDNSDVEKSRFENYDNFEYDTETIRNMFVFKKENGGNLLNVTVYECTNTGHAQSLFDYLSDSAKETYELYKKERGKSVGYDEDSDEYEFFVQEKEYEYGGFVKIKGAVVTSFTFSGERRSDELDEFYDFMSEAGFPDMEDLLD